MDESFPAKSLKSNKMINHTTLRSEPTLHISGIRDDQTSLRLIIRSMVLQMQFVNAIGR